MGLLLAAAPLVLGAAAPAVGSLGTVATVAGLAGTGIAAAGALEQGQAQAAEANYQAQVSSNNAIIAGQYAQQATQTGQLQAFETGLQERQKEQAITAGIAAGGINVNTGSAADVRESQRELGTLDVNTVLNQAALQAYGYRTQQTSFQAESQLQHAEAGFDTTAGWLSGVGTLLSGSAYWGAYGANQGVLGNPSNTVNPGTGYSGAGGYYQPTAGGAVF